VCVQSFAWCCLAKASTLTHFGNGIMITIVLPTRNKLLLDFPIVLLSCTYIQDPCWWWQNSLRHFYAVTHPRASHQHRLVVNKAISYDSWTTYMTLLSNEWVFNPSGHQVELNSTSNYLCFFPVHPALKDWTVYIILDRWWWHFLRLIYADRELEVVAALWFCSRKHGNSVDQGLQATRYTYNWLEDPTWTVIPQVHPTHAHLVEFDDGNNFKLTR